MIFRLLEMAMSNSNLKSMCKYIASIIVVKSLLLTWDTVFCWWDTAIRAIRSYWHRALGDLGKRISGWVGWWATVINPRLGQMLLLEGCHDWGAHTCNAVRWGYKLVSEDSPLQYCSTGGICNTYNICNTAVLANWWCQDWGVVHPCWPPSYCSLNPPYIQLLRGEVLRQKCANCFTLQPYNKDWSDYLL